MTKRLPFHREVWQPGPFVLALAGFAVPAWASYRLARRWAALVTFAIALSASSPVQLTLMTAAHGPAYVVMCVLAGFLLLVATRPLPRVALIGVATVVGSLTGVNIASDPLLLLVGIIPFVGAPLVRAGLQPIRAHVRVLAIAGGTASVAASSRF